MLDSHSGNSIARCALLLAICVFVLPAAAQERETAESDPAVVQWLSEPPRHDIKASLEISRPYLNFAQRLTLVVRVEIPVKQLQAATAHRDLYLAVKAGDGTRWEPSGSYTHYEITRDLGKHDTVEFVATLYVRPRRWVVGVVLYDKILNQRTTLRKEVNVAQLKNDPLPRLDAGLPEVEFSNAGEEPLPAAPSPATVGERTLGQMSRGGGFGTRRGARAGRPGSSEPEPSTAPADQSLATERNEESLPPVPLELRRPVALDVLVDFTPSEQYSGSNRMLRRTESTFWDITQVLTRLRSPDLCMRVTGVDVIGQRTLFQQMDAADMDWAYVAGELDKLDANTVQVQTLESRTKTAAFFRNAVDDLLSHKDASCDPAAEHVYVIAASGILFPSGTPSKPIEGTPVPLYYLRAHLLWNDQWDAMAKIVKPLRPRLININDPAQFRAALAEIVKDLEGTK